MGNDRLAALIQDHLARYPAAELSDVYKLLHQATFGPGHAIVNKKTAREWLEHEAGQVCPSVQEPLVERLHPDGAIVRVHLRPYLMQTDRLKWLLEAFIRSGEAVSGDLETMAARWGVFVAMCAPGGPLAGEFPARELELFGRARQSERWPAVQHSPAYVAAYHPAYRVLTADEAASLCGKLGVPFEPA